MVGPMSAALALVAMLSGAMIGEMKTCNDQGAVKIVGGSCIYFEIYKYQVVKWDDARFLCRGHSNGATKWDLPKVDSLQKNEALGEIMRNNSIDKRFWIGLVRVNGNEDSWNDPTKWLWTSDNSTLAESFPKNDAPWDNGEPNGREQDDRCVLIRLDNKTKWTDDHCEDSTVVVLVCEGTNMSMATTTMSTTAASMTTTMGTTTAGSVATTTEATTTNTTAATTAMTTEAPSTTETATTIAATTIATSGTAEERTATSVTTTGTVGSSSTSNATVDNGIRKIDPQSMPKDTSTALSGYVWAAIGLLLLAVVIVVSLLTVYFTKRYRKRQLHKWRIRHSSITSTSVSSERRGLSSNKKKKKGRKLQSKKGESMKP